MTKRIPSALSCLFSNPCLISQLYSKSVSERRPCFLHIIYTIWIFAVKSVCKAAFFEIILHVIWFFQLCFVTLFKQNSSGCQQLHQPHYPFVTVLIDSITINRYCLLKNGFVDCYDLPKQNSFAENSSI